MLRVSPDRHRLETLIEINNLINTNYTDIKELLTRIIESATKLSKGEASSLLLVNAENSKLYFEIALGAKGREIKRFSLNMGEGIAGWVAQKNTSLIVNDVSTDNRFKADISEKVGYPTHSILAVPMRVKDKCVGVIEILNKEDGQEFNDEDLQWLEIFATQAAIAIQNAQAYQKAKEEIFVLQEKVQHSTGYHPFIYKSRAISDKLVMAVKAAKTDLAVLILGESGVGKELFAEQIHLASNRRDGPFIRVNCAAIPGGLLESELFGHVKGAFTDASKDRRGRFELADGGTIFLDEIGDLPLGTQAKLLRVLQYKTFEKLGSSESITVDIRIIAATNKDLDKLVEKKQFRTDLYYRLNVLPIRIPPLRERIEDIPALVEYFLDRFRGKSKKKIPGITSEGMERLLSYAWPGNVRELENVMERAVVVTTDEEKISGDVMFPDQGVLTDVENYHGKPLKSAVSLFKKRLIKETLESNRWNQTQTANILGIQRTYLSRLIKDLGISRN